MSTQPETPNPKPETSPPKPETRNPKPPPPRIALWTAVSSKPQAAADKTSLADQEAAGRKFAAAISGHVVRLYSIPGHTRDLIFWTDAEAAMDAYRQLRLDCAGHAFDVLFALDPDRLGRDPALSNQVISLVEKSGAEVYFASAPHPIGQATAGHRYIYAIQTVRAHEDQALRTRRFRFGISARVRRGLPANHWPLGYIPIPGPTGAASSARLDPDLAPAIQLATRLFLQGQPYAAIVRALNASPYHPPRAPRWTYSTTHKILNSDFYAGYPTWAGVAPTDPSPHYPALWDPATHTRIIRERARRGHHRRHKSTGSPLSGIVHCARCGSYMTRHLNHRKTYALRCSKHNRASTTGDPCHCNYINETEVISAIADHLRTLTDPAALDLALSADNPTAPLRQDLATTEAHIHDLAHRRQRLALALAAGHMDPQLYHTTDDLLLEDLHALEREHQRLHQLIAAAPDPEQRRAAILALIPAFETLITTAPPVRIRTLLQNAGLRVQIEAGAITTIELT